MGTNRRLDPLGPISSLGRHRGVVWIGVWTLILSLLSPIMSVWHVDTASAALQDEECAPGFFWNEETGQCEQQDQQGQFDIDVPSVVATLPPDGDFELDVTPTVSPQLPTIPPVEATIPSDVELQVTVTPSDGPQLPPPPIDGTLPPDVELQVTPTSTPGTVEPPPTILQLEEIEVTKWECPPEIDPASDWATLTSSCDTPASMPFTMTHAWPSGITSTSTADFAEWAGLSGPPYFPPHFIGEEVPSGYDMPVAWCGLYTPGVSEPVLTYRSLDEHGMVVVDAPESAGQHFSCDWFNFPLVNQLVVNMLVCPPGTTLPEDIDAYLANCVDDTEGGYEFTLTTATGVFTDTTEVGTGDASTDGVVSWRGMSNGSFSVQETLPEGSPDPHVWCGSFPLDVLPHPESIPLDPVDAPGGLWEGTFEEGPNRIVCYWFSMSDEPTTSAFAVQAATPEVADPPMMRAVEILVLKRECPPGIDPATPWTDLISICGSPTSIPFTLTHGVEGGTESSQTTTGFAEWSELSPGVHYIREDVPAGYAEPVVWCAVFNPGDSGATSRPYAVEGGNTIRVELLDGQHLECDWFNFRTDDIADDGHRLTVTKFSCPEGVDPALNLPDLSTTCESVGDVEFTAIYGIFSPSRLTDHGGIAAWSDIPDGPWSIQEMIPEGYGEPKVYCGPAGGAEATEVPSSGGYIEGSFAPGDPDLECSWFNFAMDGVGIGGRQLTITKLSCPEGTDPSLGLLDLDAACVPFAGVEFTATFGESSSSETTGRDGTVSWTAVPDGPWSIQETVPRGEGEPKVFCGPIDGTEALEVPSASGYVEGNFAPDDPDLDCFWFNFTIPGFWHALKIQKLNCPAGTDRDLPLADLEATCAVAPGIEFEISITGVGLTNLVTDGAGMIVTTEYIPSTSWSIQESIPEGYGEPKVYCGPADGADGTEASVVPTTGGYIEGSFDAGDPNLVCIWLNFREADGTGINTVTFYKHLCPANTELGDDLDAAISLCPDMMNGVPFTITTDDGTFPGTTVAGMVEWTNVANGAIQLDEDTPLGFNKPKVWCAQFASEPGDEVPDDLPYEPVPWPVGGPRVTIEEAPVQVICHWFNVPNDENIVVVRKYNCESEPVGFSSLSEWQEACPTMGDGVGFTLTDIDDPRHNTTEDGEVSWTGISPGPFSIAEDPQPGYGEPVVWCSWSTEGDGGTTTTLPALVSSAGGIIHDEVTTGSNTTYTCHWFNIPDETPGGGSTIIVQKHICPERVDSDADYEAVLALDCTERGDGIEFTLDSARGSSTKTIEGGMAVWRNVPEGPFTLAETTDPARFPDPVWYCFGRYVDDAGDAIAEPIERASAPLGILSASIEHPSTTYTCYVYNFPFFDRTVTVHKWLCPDDFDPTVHMVDACDVAMPDVAFTLTDASGSMTKTTTGGTASWYGVEQGDLMLDEEIPPGYEEPIVYCALDAVDVAGIRLTEDQARISTTDGAVSRTVNHFEFDWVCDYYNISKGEAEITIQKWTCPPGYDVEAFGADPTTDCTEGAVGVEFRLTQPAGPEIVTATGDTLLSAVHFGSLDPGTYAVTETVPDGVDSVFVWDCVGTDIDAVHPAPLSVGNVLNIDVAGGDSIVCNWYNVPAPEGGSLTVTKYSCWTPTFISEVDCEIYEHGASLELFQVAGGISHGVGTTGPTGTYTWNGLPEGTYQVEEVDHAPCHITMTREDTEGNALVQTGEETVVMVYNCASDMGTPPADPGKPPTDWPDTGVAPAGGVAPSLQGTPETSGTPAPGITSEEFYEVSCLKEPISVDELDGTAGWAQGDAEATSPPIQLIGTPDASEACVRGAVPTHLTIDAADVDADIEVVEIVDGVMQAPSGPNITSWYKETGRLGEANNIVMAGHLNYWNVPEGVFYHLDELEEGDRIEVAGEDGLNYVYAVQWVRQESNFAPPSIDVVGPTDEPSLTLITCGGEWDASIAQYNERTVVRAIQVEVLRAEDASEAGDAPMLRAA